MSARPWLPAKERERRRLAYEEAPQRLRAIYWREFKRLRPRIGDRAADREAWLIFTRASAWERRAHDAKPCTSCGASVLWRVEARRPTPVNRDLSVHTCGEDRR